MRPRHKKHFEERFERAKKYLVDEPGALKGAWREEFARGEIMPAEDTRAEQSGGGGTCGGITCGGNAHGGNIADCEAGVRRELHLEIGAGKGGFIIGKALRHPEIYFVAVEIVPDVILAAMERLCETSEAEVRAGRAPITNVRFILGNAVLLGEYFTENEVDEIYVNFSDPWPRPKQYKNRLTHINFLNIYKGFLKDGGIIAQKTDNKDLFDFSVASLRDNGFDVTVLENEPEDNVRTEYEQKFIDLGVPINRLVAVLAERDRHGAETKRKARFYTHGGAR